MAASRKRRRTGRTKRPMKRNPSSILMGAIALGAVILAGAVYMARSSSKPAAKKRRPVVRRAPTSQVVATTAQATPAPAAPATPAAAKPVGPVQPRIGNDVNNTMFPADSAAAALRNAIQVAADRCALSGKYDVNAEWLASGEPDMSRTTVTGGGANGACMLATIHDYGWIPPWTGTISMSMRASVTV